MNIIVVKVKVAQSCLTLWDPMDYIVHGILQARILEWVVFPFSRGSSQCKDWTQVSWTVGRFFTSRAFKYPRSSRQNFNKAMLALNNMLNQMDLIDIFRTYHPNTAEYIYLSSAYWTFSKTAHILGHKINLNK